MLTIMNKRAGGFNRDEASNIERILSMQDNGLNSEVLFTESIADLVSKIEDYKSHSQNGNAPDILGIGGGDGAAHIALTNFYKIFWQMPSMIAGFPIGTIVNWVTPFDLTNGLVDQTRKDVRKTLDFVNFEYFNKLLLTKAEKMAIYIARKYARHEQLKTSELGILDVNSLKAFNIGFGLTTKVLWIYYGGTPEGYDSLVFKADNLFNARDKYSEIVKVPNEYFDPHVKKGFYTTLRTLKKIFANLALPYSSFSKFFWEVADFTMKVDGQEVQIDKKYNGAIISSHESVGIGLNGIAFKPTYRARTGIPSRRFQIVMSSLKPLELLPYVPTIFLGQPIQNKGIYDEMAHTVECSFPKASLIQIDGELYLAKGLKIEYDQTLRIINPNLELKM